MGCVRTSSSFPPFFPAFLHSLLVIPSGRCLELPRSPTYLPLYHTPHTRFPNKLNHPSLQAPPSASSSPPSSSKKP